MGRGTVGLAIAGAILAAAPAAGQEGPAPVPKALESLFGEEYDRALAAVGLDRASARVDALDQSLFAAGRFRTPLYEALQADPARADRYARTLREGAFANAESLEKASMFAAARLGASVRLTLLGDPLEKEMAEAAKPGALEAAVREAGARTVPPADAVPEKVRTAAALVLRAEKRAKEWIRRAIPSEIWDPPGLPGRDAAHASLVLSGKDEDDALRAEFEDAAARADPGYLARAAAEVAVAVDRACALLREAGPGPSFDYRVLADGGWVLLRGSGDDADADGDGVEVALPYVLRIDTGGNDRYGGGAAASPRCPVSVLIDVAGDDTYESPPDAAAFGAGFCGVGMLADLGGNDRYALRGDRSVGLGAGVFGVGALLDAVGDDAYSGVGLCQGAGAVGWGTLCDLGGKDRYDAYSFAQGFGFVRGAGLLADLGGDDAYALNDEDIRSPSAQAKDHNTSMGQGAGYGVRADYLDGHSLAGGVGILADRGGDDAYSCGVFGQGTAYWMGVGMLLDGGGNDSYRGVWYVQGATAHFAVAVLEDAGGDDAYAATRNMAQGAGHDYSLGVLLDRAGNDRYRAPNLSLGGGNADGVGVLIDGGGDDRYESQGVTLGYASVATPADAPTIRHGSLTLGVFLDLGGKDEYVGPGEKPWPFAGDGRTWRQHERAGKDPVSNERGVGADR
jgi:hypothetical protein